jgi:hypothetical protein
VSFSPRSFIASTDESPSFVGPLGLSLIGVLLTLL